MNQVTRCLRIIIPFTAVFLLSGILHIVLYGVDFTNTIVQLYWAVFVMLWFFSIRRRITDRHILFYLYGMAILLVVMSLVQASRYTMFDDPTSERYCWYAYYVPFIFVPLFFIQVSYRLNRQEGIIARKWWTVTYVPAVALFLLVMTNDLHTIVFQFPEGIEKGVSVHTYGITFYLIWVLVIAQNIVSLILIFKQCRVNASRKMLWLPCFFEAIFIAGQVMFFTDSFIRLDGVLIWNQGEFFIFAMVGLAESCIEMGLIPANTDYRKLFALVNDSAIINDTDGMPVFTSAQAEAFFSKKDVVVNTKNIHGGKVCYGVDMRPVYGLNKSLQAENDRIKARIRLLKSSNALESEKSRLNTQNKIYDKIYLKVRPQLDKIDQLLSSTFEEDFSQNLARAAVYSAYIKRRSNLELLNTDSAFVDIRELTTAVGESLEYIKLLGADTMLSATSSGPVPKDMLILFYDYFEGVVENSIESIKSLFAVLSGERNSYRLKLLINADAVRLPDNIPEESLHRYNGQASITQEDGEQTIVLSLSYEGGEE